MILDLLVTSAIFNVRFSHTESLNPESFPDDFAFGVATSAFQIEGAWNVSGKGENIWDYLTHTFPTMIEDQSNADVACDSYFKFAEDVAILEDLGVDFYRFSLSWTRILPNGFKESLNEDGIRYYNEILNSLQDKGIKAMVTIYHWDLPQPLQEYGGWLNSSIIEAYVDYANVVFEYFGDLVEEWITINEPYQVCREGYGSTTKAPAYNDSGVSDYLCGYHLLKAHAKAWHLYNDSYRNTQNGKIGIVIQAPWVEPNSTKEEDEQAAERLRQFYFGWFAHPIFSEEGNYPDVMIQNVGIRSALEGLNASRLPAFSEEEVNYIKGTSDFFGVNHYTTIIAAASTLVYSIGKPSFVYDLNVTYFYESSWENSSASWLKVVPWGFRKLLIYFKERYNNPAIYVTENGFADNGEIEDSRRIHYHQAYLSSILDALLEGVNVKKYAVWSLIDNFEWMAGYAERFGLVYVNFNDSNRSRTYKASASFYKNFIKERKLITESGCNRTLSTLILISVSLIINLLYK